MHIGAAVSLFTQTQFKMLAYLLLTIIVFLTLSWLFLKRRLNYWKYRKVPQLEPKPILGNFADYILLRKYVGKVTQDILTKFPDEPYVGVYYGTEPALIIQNPELIKLITTKDYYYFSSREISKYTHKEVFTQNMFFTYGDRWKVLRQNLSPIFSSAKMKNMFHLIEKCCHVFDDLLLEESKAKSVEIRSLMARYTMDCIGSCAFGIETNAMGKDVENNSFKKLGDLIFEISNVRGFFLIARAIWPSIFYGLGLKVFPPKMNTFFSELLTGVFKARNYEASSRNDFIDLMLNMKKSQYIVGDSLSNLKSESGKKVSLKADDALLVAQCLTFFAAGFETSATTLSYTFYELAKNIEAQKLAAEEVKKYLQKHKRVDYSCVTELPYLEACIDEALRLYPVLGLLTREVVSDYTLPSGLQLSEGLRIHLPVYHLHRDPRNFPDPQRFKPERFLPENKQNIKPYTYMPFGEGPRICIGMRFAKMQMLAGLVTLLNSYSVELAPGMPEVLELEPRAIVTQPTQGIHVKLVPRVKKLGD